MTTAVTTAPTVLWMGFFRDDDISATSGGKRGQNMFKTAKSVLTFRPNVYFLLAYFFIQVPISIGHGAIALYAQYSLDLEDQIENVLLAFMVASVLAMPVIGWVVSKLGRKTSYICFMLTGERLDTPFVAIFLSCNSLAITVGLIMATIVLDYGGQSFEEDGTTGSAVPVTCPVATGPVFLRKTGLQGQLSPSRVP
uniref:Uncharacterized protein n=1 Tax=Branchiostoma floridae TaxID=7739 RepID=C3Y156_BRAFL|eukprot:XP_002609586.1 hypothetical protein BRAFLDRAFT_87800 [Branchiostoma floridae]